METQARQLSAIIENMMYYFGTQSIDGECCENVSHGEFRALHAAMHQNICTMQDIARSALVTKSGATRIVTRLEEKELVRREQNDKDGRVCCLKLTAEGEALMARIDDQLTDKMLSILTAMEPAMRDILIISLSAFLQAAEKQMMVKDRMQAEESAKGRRGKTR